MTIFTTRKFTVPGLLPDDALQEQLKQFGDSQKADAKAAPPPTSAFTFADRIVDGFLEPHRMAVQARDAGERVGSLVPPRAAPTPAPDARTAQNQRIEENSTALAGPLGQFLLTNPLTGPTAAWLGIAEQAGTLSAEESQIATEERLQDMQGREAAIKSKAEVRAKLRSMTDEEAGEMGLPVAPGGTDLVDQGLAAMDDLKVVTSAAEQTAGAKAGVEGKGPKVTQTWWLNSIQTAARSAAQMGITALKYPAIVYEDLGTFYGLRDGDLKSEPRVWLDTVDAAITKLLPGDKIRSKDFLTELSAGIGSFAGFMLAGYVGTSLGLPAGVAPAVLGGATQGVEMREEAEQFDATGLQKFMALIIGSGLGMTEAIPIDRMFMRADRATGGLVRRMLRNSTAGSIEEFMQEMSQAIGEDVTAKWLVGFDPDRELDPREWVRRGLIGGITGAAGGAVVGVSGGTVSMMPADIREAYIQAAIEDAQLTFDAIEGAQEPDADMPLAEQTEATVAGVDRDVDASVEPRQPVEAQQQFRGGTMPALRDDGRIELTHWSDSARAVLDPQARGTGPLRGQERARLFGSDAVDRTYYGVQATAQRPQRSLAQFLREREQQEPTPKNATPREKQVIRQQREQEFYAEARRGPYVREGGLGNARHTVAVEPDDLYNWYEDPQNLKQGLDRTLTPNEQITQYERIIRDAGFRGYFIDEGPQGQTAALFDQAQPERIVDERTGEDWDVVGDDLAAMRAADPRLQPLPGTPKNSTGPIPQVVSAAEAYAKSIGLPLRRQATYVKADPERGKRIAQAYEDMKHDPNDPAVAAAYQALIEETLAQYQFVKASGLEIEFIEQGQADPYPEGPKQVLQDLQRGHLWVFPTDQGFGTLTEISDNPLLAPTEEFVGERQLLANDVFRIVHDFFGHGLEGAGFGASGEENAWQSHMRLFTPAAVPAMTSETRGQNSWVNFGPHGEANRSNQRETVYADQKTGLMPAWTWQEGVEDDLDAAYVPVRGEPLPLFPERTDQSFDRWFADSEVRNADGSPMVVFHGTPAEGGFNWFDPTKQGKTSVLFSVLDQHRQGFFFAENEAFAKTFAEQKKVGGGKVMPVFLSIQNAFDARVLDRGTRLRMEEVEARIAEIDPAYNARFFTDRVGADDFWEVLDTAENGDVVVQAMRDLGYDGIRMIEPNHDNRESETVWVAFDNTQIKSAVANTGAYNPTNPDMEAARAPGTAAARTPYVGEQTRDPKGTPEQPNQEPNDASLARISRNFVQLLNLTARHGRFTLRGSEVMGQYKRSAATVRLRTWNDLSTLVHEGGHALHDGAIGALTSWINTQAVGLTAVANRLYGGGQQAGSTNPMTMNLTPDQLRREGFAEFFRVYTLNRAYAQREFPQLTQEFTTLLETSAPEIKIGLDAIGTQFMAYLQAPSTQVLGNQIVSGYQDTGINAAIAEIKDMGFPSWMQEHARRTVEYTINRYAPLNILVSDLLNVGERNVGAPIDLTRAADPRTLIRLAPHSGSRAMVQLTDGVMGYHSLQPETRSLREAILISQGLDPKRTPGAFDETKLKDFSTFLVAMRALDEYRRFKEGKISRPPIGLGLGDVQQVIDDMLAKYGEAFTEAGAIVNEYGIALWKKTYDAGLMSKDVYEAGLDRRFYVPLQRDMSDKKAELGASAITGGRSIVRKFRGSDRDIVDPLAVLMHKTFALESAIAKNDVAVALAKLADRAGQAGALVERVPAQTLMGSTFSVEQVARQLTKDDTISEMDAQDLMTILDASMENDNAITLFRSEQASAKGENILFFWEEGRVAAIQLKDGSVGSDIINMFNGLGRENMQWGMELIAGTSSVFRSAITSWPDFLIVNFIRDQFSAAILTDVGFKPFWTGIKGVGDELRQRTWAKQANAAQMLMGGMNVSALHEARLNRDIDALRAKGYLPRVFAEPGIMGKVKGLARFVELTETGTRLGLFRGAFERAKRDGLNDYEAGVEAAYLATDYIDFGLNGSRMLMARRTIPFLNAQLQGLYKMMRTLGADEVRQRRGLRFVLGAYFKSTKNMPLSRVEKQALNTGRKAWVKMLSLGMLSALIHFIFEDDEDYQEAGEYLRTTGWVLPLGDGRVFYIPKPFELAILANVIERGLESAGGDSEAKNRFLRGAALTLMPPTSPPALQVLVEHAANKDFFTGQAIIPDYMQALEPELQYNNYTSELAKSIGDITGWSPMVVDHYLSGLGASAYRDFQWASNAVDPDRPTTDATDRPIVRRFVRDVRKGSATSRDFWAQASKLNGRLQTAANTYKGYLEGGNEIAANGYLMSLQEDERAFAILDAHFEAKAKRLNPFYRARELNGVVSAMRREIVSDLGLEDTTKGLEGVIPLTAKQKHDVDELLSEYARREMRNTLVATGAPGWSNKKMLDTEATMALLDRTVPTVGEEFRRRLNKRKVYDAALVFSSWPDLKNRLISDRDLAFVDDLTTMAEALLQ